MKLLKLVEEDINFSDKELYSILVGFVVDMGDKLGSKKTFDQMVVMKEIRIYYENMRDGITPQNLSPEGVKFDSYVKSEVKKLSGEQLKHLLDLGKNVRTQ